MIHVAVGVVVRAGTVLISRRAEHLHQGGLWEFPGGKVEARETVFNALCREFLEECGLQVRDARPMMEVHHGYEDREVLLDVWWVDQFTGEAHGREGQEVLWQPIDTLLELPFPAADAAIIHALQNRVTQPS